MASLSFNEKQLISAVGKNSFEEVKQLLNEHDVNVNCYDENGMSALQHAAYKGNYDICKFLIERGADANSNEHVNGYTALMFAALGGYKNVVNLLLEAGANVTSVNSVGRNAAQMAAFVGQHAAVSIINNFISIKEIQYYTVIHGLEKEPKLSSALVIPLHSLVRQTNIHPVRIVLFLKNNIKLIENGNQVIKVLELMCEKQFKKTDPSEILSLKFHHLAFTLRQIVTFLTKEQQQEKDEKESQDKEYIYKKMDLLMKTWIKGRESDGFPVVLEKLLRQSVREFPYQKSVLFQQSVCTLSSVEIGEEPSAITMLSQTINGHKGFDENSPSCSTCAEPNPPKVCSGCKSVLYCDFACQKLHWFTHKNFCKKIQKSKSN